MTIRRAALLAGLATLALAGCGGDRDDDGPRPPDPGAAEAEIGRAFPEAVKPAASVGDGLRPALASGPQAFAVRGTLAAGAIARFAAAGFWLATGSGRLRAVPAAPEDARVAQTVADGDAVLFAGVAPAVDLLVRPQPAGLETFAVVTHADGASAMRWRLSLPGDERLLTLSKGNVGILAPPAETEPRATGRMTPPRNTAGKGSGTSPLSDALGGAFSPNLPPRQRVMATLSAPRAVDARGRSARARLSVEGDAVTLAVRLGEDAEPPVVARVDWTPSGPLGGGWFGYGVDRALRRSAWQVAGRRLSGVGCGTVNQGELGPGELEVEREVAFNRATCRTLSERGRP